MKRIPKAISKESSQWSEPLAVVIAENEGITLSPEHWEVVFCA